MQTPEEILKSYGVDPNEIAKGETYNLNKENSDAFIIQLQSKCQHDVTPTSQRSGSPMVCSKCGYIHKGRFIHN